MQQAPGGGGLMATHAGGSAAPAASAPAAGGSAPSSVRGGNFINLQDYLSANAGQAQHMAGNVLNPIESKGDALKSGRPTSLAESAGMSFAPATGQSRPSQQQAAGEVESQAGLLGSWGGREQLLRQQAGPQYSQGEANFDNALLGGAAGARMADLSKRYSGLADMVGGRKYASTAPMTPPPWTGTQKGPYEEQVDNGPNNKAQDSGAAGENGRTQKDLTGGANAGKDPNSLSDEELSAMGYMDGPAPGESYAHYSDRIAGRTKR